MKAWKINNERVKPRCAAFKCQCVAGIQGKRVFPGMRTKLLRGPVYSGNISPLKRVNVSLPFRKMTTSSCDRGK